MAILKLVSNIVVIFSLFNFNSHQLLTLKVKGRLNFINPQEVSSLKHVLGRDVIKTVVFIVLTKILVQVP